MVAERKPKRRYDSARRIIVKWPVAFSRQVEIPNLRLLARRRKRSWSWRRRISCFPSRRAWRFSATGESKYQLMVSNSLVMMMTARPRKRPIAEICHFPVRFCLVEQLYRVSTSAHRDFSNIITSGNGIYTVFFPVNIVSILGSLAAGTVMHNRQHNKMPLQRWYGRPDSFQHETICTT